MLDGAQPCNRLSPYPREHGRFDLGTEDRRTTQSGPPEHDARCGRSSVLSGHSTMKGRQPITPYKVSFRIGAERGDFHSVGKKKHAVYALATRIALVSSLAS